MCFHLFILKNNLRPCGTTKVQVAGFRTLNTFQRPKALSPGREISKVVELIVFWA